MNLDLKVIMLLLTILFNPPSIFFKVHYEKDKYAYQAFKSAVERLNASFPPSLTKGGLEKYVEFRIFHYWFKREVLFKINADLDENVKQAIKDSIESETKKLRMTVGTVRV